jgi:hypothetical protein
MKKTLAPEVWFHRLGTQYVLAQILFHLNQCGVFNDMTEKGPSTSEDVARRLKLDPKILECLLDYVLNVDELLTKDQQNRYAFTDFGLAVLRRYERVDNGQRQFNFLDVRIGGYGIVWSSISEMLTGRARYGHEVKRDGRFAEDGLYKSAVGFVPAIKSVLKNINPDAVVEWGVNSGILERLVDTQPKAKFYGLDRSQRAIDKAADRMPAEAKRQVQWIKADLFEPDIWVRELGGARTPLFFSVHFHEIMAEGEERVRDLIRKMVKLFPGASVLALEQPRLPDHERETLPENLWLYSHSNILIHHLIGNGRILSGDEWIKLFLSSGCQLLACEPTGYLGYVAYSFKLGASS